MQLVEGEEKVGKHTHAEEEEEERRACGPPRPEAVFVPQAFWKLSLCSSEIVMKRLRGKEGLIFSVTPCGLRLSPSNTHMHTRAHTL